jgi:hypothetical protein
MATHGIMPHGTTPNQSGTAGIKGMVTNVTSSIVKKQKLQIIRTHSKITQIKQEKTQSYTSLQGASNECRHSA